MPAEWKVKVEELFRELGNNSPFDENDEIRRQLREFGHRESGFTPIEDSIYHVFSRLTELCIAAHESGDRPTLERIYRFAEWCWDKDEEEGQDLSNAVGVSFFEDIVRSPAVRRDLPEWLKPRIYQAVKGLFSCGAFITASEWEELRARCTHLESPLG